MNKVNTGTQADCGQQDGNKTATAEGILQGKSHQYHKQENDCAADPGFVYHKR